MAACRVFPGLDSTIFSHILTLFCFWFRPHILKLFFCITQNAWLFIDRTIRTNTRRRAEQALPSCIKVLAEATTLAHGVDNAEATTATICATSTSATTAGIVVVGAEDGVLHHASRAFSHGTSNAIRGTSGTT